MTTSEHSPDSAASTAADVLYAYIANYEGRDGGADTIFGAANADALAGLLYARLMRSLDSPVARAVAHRRVEPLTATALAEPVSPALNLAGYVRASTEGLVEDRSDDLARVMDLGARTEAITGIDGVGWRALFLSIVLPTLHGSMRADVDQELKRRAGYLIRRAGDEARSATDAARLAFFLAEIGAVTRRRSSRAAAEELVERLASRQLRNGAPRSETNRRQPAPTAQIAFFVLAANAVGARDAGDAALAYMLADRTDPDKKLLVKASDERDRFETSPWVPIALLSTLTSSPDLARIEPIFDPPAPEPPNFALARIRTTKTSVAYDVELGGAKTGRTIDSSDLNQLVAHAFRRYAHMNETALSPRGHAHRVLSLYSLVDAVPAEQTIEAANRFADQSLSYIIKTQHKNGGWFYSRKNVPTEVYSGGEHRVSTFRDLQYTIDAALPGAALSRAYERTGEERYRKAANRVLAFFEEKIGRVTWQDFSVWRLYPEDQKTHRMGTAVNYELWGALFFAYLSRIATDEDRGRLESYIEESVRYAESQMTDDGDIAYGDYVREARTAYASWDSYLLTEIGHAINKPNAVRAGQRIADGLARLVLPSGAMPNVVDYEERVGEKRRWLVHRHGIGPYPIRTDYQLYYVVATALADGEKPAHRAALRALGFIMLHLYERTFSGGTRGYLGDGELQFRRNFPVPALDWFILAVSQIRRIAFPDYLPDHLEFRTGQERMLREIEEQFATAESRGHGEVGQGRDAYLPDVDYAYADGFSHYGLGCSALARSTGDKRWVEAAVRCADWLLANDSSAALPQFIDHRSWGLPWPYTAFAGPAAIPAHFPFTVTTAAAGHLLLDAHGLTGDKKYLEAALDASRWLIDECGYDARPDGVAFHYGSHRFVRESARASIVYNAHSEAVGFLARVSRSSELHDLERIVWRGLDTLVARQDSDGLWPYAEATSRKEHHQAMVLRGLLNSWQAGFQRDDLAKAISTALEGCRTRLFDPELGSGRIAVDSDDPMWAQFAALFAWSFWSWGSLTDNSRHQDMALRITRYLFHAYRQIDGTFSLTPLDRSSYVRPRAEVFHCLARIWESDPNWADRAHTLPG